MNETASSGFVIRDHTGKVLSMGTTKYGYNSILQTEALALREGNTRPKQMGFRKVEVEGDNLIVINASKGIGKFPWEIEMLVLDI